LAKAKEKIAGLTDDLHVFAEYIAWLDVFSSHAILAKEKKYIQAELTPSSALHIVGGRHPVIEEFLPQDLPFVPNDLKMGNKPFPDCHTSFAMTGEKKLND